MAHRVGHGQRKREVRSLKDIAMERTKFEATERTLAEVKRAVEALITIKNTDVNANGVFIQPRQKLVALKAAREHINRAIEAIESKWPRT